MREKRKTLRTFELPLRITPAYAGKTKVGWVAGWILSGSPPRMREKLSEVKLQRRDDVDHPRVCGKNRVNYNIRLDFLGSPPRMREKLPISLQN